MLASLYLIRECRPPAALDLRISLLVLSVCTQPTCITSRISSQRQELFIAFPYSRSPAESSVEEVSASMSSPSPLLSPLHRIPVLWSLYRPLIRLSGKVMPRSDQQQTDFTARDLAGKGDALQAHIRRLFRRATKLGNLQQVKKRLGEAHSVRSCSEEALDSPS